MLYRFSLIKDNDQEENINTNVNVLPQYQREDSKVKTKKEIQDILLNIIDKNFQNTEQIINLAAQYPLSFFEFADNLEITEWQQFIKPYLITINVLLNQYGENNTSIILSKLTKNNRMELYEIVQGNWFKDPNNKTYFLNFIINNSSEIINHFIEKKLFRYPTQTFQQQKEEIQTSKNIDKIIQLIKEEFPVFNVVQDFYQFLNQNFINLTNINKDIVLRIIVLYNKFWKSKIFYNSINEIFESNLSNQELYDYLTTSQTLILEQQLFDIIGALKTIKLNACKAIPAHKLGEIGGTIRILFSENIITENNIEQFIKFISSLLNNNISLPINDPTKINLFFRYWQHNDYIKTFLNNENINNIEKNNFLTALSENNKYNEFIQQRLYDSPICVINELIQNYKLYQQGNILMRHFGPAMRKAQESDIKEGSGIVPLIVKIREPIFKQEIYIALDFGEILSKISDVIFNAYILQQTKEKKQELTYGLVPHAFDLSETRVSNKVFRYGMNPIFEDILRYIKYETDKINLDEDKEKKYQQIKEYFCNNILNYINEFLNKNEYVELLTNLPLASLFHHIVRSFLFKDIISEIQMPIIEQTLTKQKDIDFAKSLIFIKNLNNNYGVVEKTIDKIHQQQQSGIEKTQQVKKYLENIPENSKALIILFLNEIIKLNKEFVNIPPSVLLKLVSFWHSGGMGSFTESIMVLYEIFGNDTPKWISKFLDSNGQVDIHQAYQIYNFIDKKHFPNTLKNFLLQATTKQNINKVIPIVNNRENIQLIKLENIVKETYLNIINYLKNDKHYKNTNNNLEYIIESLNNLNTNNDFINNLISFMNTNLKRSVTADKYIYFLKLLINYNNNVGTPKEKRSKETLALSLPLDNIYNELMSVSIQKEYNKFWSSKKTQIDNITDVEKKQLALNKLQKSLDFAIECMKWGTTSFKKPNHNEEDQDDDDGIYYPSDLPSMVWLFENSPPLPEWALNSEKFYFKKPNGKNYDYVAYFLEREDPRGMFLGQYTNCCQHPQGEAAYSALHGQTSPSGAFFVVEDGEGEILAQSWTWENKYGDIIFDNIESKGLTPERQHYILEIYKNISQQIKSKYNKKVFVGLEFNKVSLPEYLPSFPNPSLYDGNKEKIEYTDAESVVQLAKNMQKLIRISNKLEQQKQYKLSDILLKNILKYFL